MPEVIWVIIDQITARGHGRVKFDTIHLNSNRHIMSLRSQALLPSTFAVLAGNALHDEFKALGKTFWQRGRKRFADYVLGPPSYYRTSTRKMVDRSLGRMTSVRRPRTKRRMASRAARKRRRRTYKRRSRGSARRAMGTNGPAFRSRMRKSRYRVELGEPMGFMPSRKVLTTGSSSTVVDKTLDSTRLVNIAWSDDDTVMNRRTGRLVDVKGVKFRAWISLKDNLVETSDIWQNPIQVRWAIINPKENTGQLSDVTDGTNFFVSDSPGADDATNFPSTGNAFRYMNRKINTRKYGVLQEGTFLLSNDPASTNTRVTPRSKKFISFYVPIHRQMKWGNNTTATHPNANLHFVWWYCVMGDKDAGKRFTTNQPFDYTWEAISYFKNPDILT